MCIALVAISLRDEYPFILLSNRDEFFSRPTSPAHFWKDSPGILGGRDKLHGGTWLGITRQGRIALVTNVRLPNVSPDKRSRGEVVSMFLKGDMSLEDFLDFLKRRGGEFNPFNLIFGDMSQLYFASNYYGDLFPLGKGVHVISNGKFGEEWPKCRRLKALFLTVLRGVSPVEPLLFLEVLRDDKGFPDEELPDTGVGLEMERFLCPIFIRGREYGTRTSTVVIYHKGEISLWERNYKRGGEISSQQNFSIFL